MKPVQSLLFFILIMITTHGIAQNRGKAGAGFTVAGNDIFREITDDFIYDIELFPGQEFSGYIYHWTEWEGDVAWGEFHENPEVDWLTVSPGSIMADGCKEPVPVKFTFRAPQKTGTYTTTVEDYEYNWSDNVITLTVTEHPVNEVTDSLIIVNGQADTFYRYQEHEYKGLSIDQSWYDAGYCGPDPYVFSQTRQINRILWPQGPGISFFPASFTLQLDEQRIVTKMFRFDENTPDSVYEVIYLEWRSYPNYIKWKFMSADDYCLGWEQIPTLNFPSLSAGATVCRDSVYLAGGLDPMTGQPTGRAEVLRDDRWGLLPSSMNQARYGFACGTLENRVYAFGGLDSNHQPLNTVEYFDGNRWIMDDDTMPATLCFHAGAGFSKSFYIFGGRKTDDREYVNSLWRYSPLTGWQVLHELLPFSSREKYGCVVADKFIYILGGERDSIPMGDAYLYDIVADTFTALSPMNRPRADFACGMAGGFIYVVGGTADSQEVSSSVEFYDPVSGKWFTCEDAPNLSVVSSAHVFLNDHLFLLGGKVSLPNGEPDYRTCYGSDFIQNFSPPPEPSLEVLAFPNPFRSEAVITFNLPYDSHVRLSLYDLRGRLICILADQFLPGGDYQYFIEGGLLAEGLYFGELKTDKDHIVKKLVKVED